MENIDFKKYKRFFAFGCSFTDYNWPTWANIIEREIPESYIYAKPGAGNFYIFQALMEATLHHKINKDDLVMIMFSNVTREDRFTRDRGWITSGNLIYQNEYDHDFLRKYLCEHGYLMRDANLIHGCRMTLDAIGCDYELMSMVPIDSAESNNKRIRNVAYILDFYEDTLSKLKPSVMEVVFDNDWNSRPNRPTYKASWAKGMYKDNHPSPLEHLEYLQKIYPDIKISDATFNFINEMNDKVFAEGFDPQKMKFEKNLYPRLGQSEIYD